MLFKNDKTSIEAIGYISKCFSLSWSTRQGCMLHRYFTFCKPTVCAIRGTDEIKGIQMSGSENVLESKICMFADDAQLFNKNEESVEQAFKVLVNN